MSFPFCLIQSDASAAEPETARLCASYSPLEIMNVEIREVAPLRRHPTSARSARIPRDGFVQMASTRAILITALILLGFTGRATAASISWTNAAGGVWTNAVNWSPNQVPGVADIAWITNAGSFTVALPVSAQVAGLELGGGGGAPTLNQTAGTLTVGGNSTVRAGGRFSSAGVKPTPSPHRSRRRRLCKV